MNKKSLLALSIASIFSMNTSASYKAFIYYTNMPTATIPMSHWYPYLEDNCTGNGTSSYPDIESWESSNNILCTGTEKNLPTVGDLNGFTGLLSIGSNANYYNLQNNQAFSGLRSGGDIAAYVEGEGVLISDYTADDPTTDELTFNIDSGLNSLSFTDVDAHKINVFGTPSQSRASNIVLDVSKTKASNLSEVNLQNLKGVSLSSTGSKESGYNIVSTNVDFDNVDLSNMGVVGKDIVFTTTDSHFNSFKAIDTSLVYTNFVQPVVTDSDLSANDVSSIYLEKTPYSSFNMRNMTKIDNITLKDLKSSVMYIDGDNTYKTPTIIGNVSMTNLSANAPFYFNYVNQIDTFNVSGINKGVGEDSQYFMTYINGTKDSTGILSGNINTMTLDDILGAGQVVIKDFRNINKLTLSNIDSNMYYDLNFIEDVNDFQITNSAIGNYMYLKANNLNNFNFVDSSFVNFIDITLKNKITNMSVENGTINNFLKINVPTVDTVSFTNINVDNFIDFKTNQLNNLTVDGGYTKTYFMADNVNNFTMRNFTADNYISLDAFNETAILNLSVSDTNIESSSAGFLWLKNYAEISTVNLNNVKLYNGLWIESSKAAYGTGYGSIGTITLNGVKNAAGTVGHQFRDVSGIAALNFTSNASDPITYINLSNIGTGFGTISITNNSAYPLVFIDRDQSFVRDMSVLSDKTNVIVALNSVAAGETPVVETKLSASSQFCLDYGTDTFVYYSDFSKTTNVGTLVDKTMICQ